MTDDLAFYVTCPLCGGAVKPTGYTKQGHRTGRCTVCGDRPTITVAPSAVMTRPTNKHAPFYRLVLELDELMHVELDELMHGPLAAYRRRELAPGEAA